MRNTCQETNSTVLTATRTSPRTIPTNCGAFAISRTITVSWYAATLARNGTTGSVSTLLRPWDSWWSRRDVIGYVCIARYAEIFFFAFYRENRKKNKFFNLCNFLSVCYNYVGCNFCNSIYCFLKCYAFKKRLFKVCVTGEKNVLNEHFRIRLLRDRAQQREE